MEPHPQEDGPFVSVRGKKSAANYTFVVLSFLQNFGWRSFPARSPLTPPARQALIAARSADE
jgi:hypothetical protein